MHMRTLPGEKQSTSAGQCQSLNNVFKFKQCITNQPGRANHLHNKARCQATRSMWVSLQFERHQTANRVCSIPGVQQHSINVHSKYWHGTAFLLVYKASYRHQHESQRDHCPPPKSQAANIIMCNSEEQNQATSLACNLSLVSDTPLKHGPITALL